MKIKLLLLFISIFSMHANAAQYCTKFEQILNKDILFCICTNYDCLEDSAKTINALARINKSLNMYINEDSSTLQLIRSLSQTFKVSNIEVAEILCTQRSNYRYLLQKNFRADWNTGDIAVKNFPRLQRMGLDLDFTYYNELTALLISIRYKEWGYITVGKWIIENSKNISAVDSNGRNAMMIAINKGNWTLMPYFLQHENLSVNHQDNKGKTALHYCMAIPQACTHRFEYIIIELLHKGANPRIKNKKGQTPIDLANKIEWTEAVNILTQKTQK